MIDPYRGLEEILLEAADGITQRLKDAMYEDDTVATGQTVNSIRSEVKGREISIRFNKALSAIDSGNAPGQHSPTVNRIISWMQAKGIQPRLKGRFVAATPGNYKRSAFAIARAIYRDGTIKRFGYQGTRLFERSWGPGYKGALTKKVKALVQNNIQQGVNVIFRANGFTNK